MINVADYLDAAAAKVEPGVWCYFEGGAGDEVTLRANAASYSRWRFRPRMLVDVGAVSTATTLLGTPVSSPLGIAPFAMQRLIDPEGEVATARAAAKAGALMCVSTLTTSTHPEIAAAGDGPRWLQLYVLSDRQRTIEHIHEARESGYSAVVLTVDLPYVGRRERDLRLGFMNPPPDLDLPYANLFETSPTLTWSDLEWIRSEMPIPLVLKGILTREDAILAVEHGADAVWVSNHGGRQLDGVAAGTRRAAGGGRGGRRALRGVRRRRHPSRERRAQGARARSARRVRRPRLRVRSRGRRRGRRRVGAVDPQRRADARARPPGLHVAGSGDAKPRGTGTAI